MNRNGIALVLRDKDVNLEEIRKALEELPPESLGKFLEAIGLVLQRQHGK